jgi:PmbA protein
MRWWVAVEWIEGLLREGEKHADEVEVFFVTGKGISADLKKRSVNLATNAEECGLGIRTIKEGKIGTSSTNNPADWKRCLQAAVDSGKLATPQPWEGLPEPAGLPEKPLSFDPALSPDPGVVQDILARMLDAASEHRAEVTSGSASLSVATTMLANSRGVMYTDRHSGVSLSLEAINGQSTGYEFDHACSCNAVDPEKVGERAAFYAEASAEGKDIETGEYDIVLSPLAYAELLGNVFIPALSGRNVHAGRSRLAQSLKKEVAITALSMYDDPHIPNGNGSTWWDAEGTPTRRIGFVTGGVLRAFAYDLKTAYRYGTSTTGSAVRGGFAGSPSIGHHNFVVDGPRTDVTDERVLYIHNVVGAHTANPMSGDFSVEISNAFFMEGGGYDTPVRSAMLSGNVFDLHTAITGMSRESRAIGSLILPSIKINSRRIIGK